MNKLFLLIALSVSFLVLLEYNQDAYAVPQVLDTDIIQAGDIVLNEPDGFIVDGDITLTSTTGDVIITGDIDVPGTGGSLTINTPAGTTMINGAIGGGIALDSLTISSSNSIVLGDITALSLTVNSGGSITDTATANINVVGAASLTASNNITLGDNAGDTTNFGTLSLSGNIAFVTEDSATDLGDITASSLTLNSAGSITDSGTISVTGLTDITADIGGVPQDVNLNNASNDFGTVNVTGDTVALVDINGIDLGDITASSLTLNSAGSITDAAGSTIAVTGVADLTATGSVTLGDNGVDTTNFGSVSISGNAVDVTEDSATVLGDITASSLTLNSAGSITDAAGSTILVSGTTTLTTASDVTLNSSNDFGTVNVTGNNVTIIDTNDIDLGNLAISGNLTVTSVGNITDSGQITVGGVTSIIATAGDVTLDTLTNDYVGAVNVTADNLYLVDSNQIVIGTIIVPGTVIIISDQDLDTVLSDVDCNDNDSSIFPGATEIPNDGIDQDCVDVAPIASCQDAIVPLPTGGSTSIDVFDIEAGSSDDVAIISSSVNPNSFSCSNLGANTVTLIVTDTPGNTATCMATVTIEDPQDVCSANNQVIGGKMIPIEQTSLILAGAQSFSWMIPVVLSVLGIGLFVVRRK